MNTIEYLYLSVRYTVSHQPGQSVAPGLHRQRSRHVSEHCCTHIQGWRHGGRDCRRERYSNTVLPVQLVVQVSAVHPSSPERLRNPSERNGSWVHSTQTRWELVLGPLHRNSSRYRSRKVRTFRNSRETLSKDKHVISQDADVVWTWELVRWNPVCVFPSEVQKGESVRTVG